MNMRIKIHIFSRNLLFILFVVYFSQGLLYETGTLVSQSCLLFIILISGAYFVKTLLIKERKSRFFRAWLLLLILNTIGFIFTMNFEPLHVNMFKNVLLCSLSFFPFYYYAQHGFVEQKHFIYLFITMLVITVFQFYNTMNNLIELQKRDDVVNNIAYSFVALIPFLFLIKKNKLISGALLAIILFYIILGNKRGAIVVSGVGSIIYIYYQLRTVEKRNRFKGYAIVLILITALGFFAYKTYQNNEYLIARMTAMTEGDSSLRNVIYANIFNSWVNSDNILNFFFGYGFAGSLKLSGGSFAHNDWLEMLSNFGLTGVLVYLFLFVAVAKTIRNNKLATDKKILLTAIASMWFATSLFSMWYTSLNAVFYVMLLGYIIGSEKQIKN